MHKLIGLSPGLQPEGSQCTPSEQVLLLPIQDSLLQRQNIDVLTFPVHAYQLSRYLNQHLATNLEIHTKDEGPRRA